MTLNDPKNTNHFNKICSHYLALNKLFFFMIFGRTDLRIAVYGAKFDAEVDFEVRFATAPPKFDKNMEKRMICVDFFQNFRKC